MTDLDHLLRAVLERPDEGGVREVLADWLEEQGEPQRAALLRDPDLGRGAVALFARVVGMGCAGTWKEFLSCIDSAQAMRLAYSVKNLVRMLP